MSRRDMYHEQVKNALPTHAYEGIFSKPIGKLVVAKLRMKLIIYSVSGEEKLLWIQPE